MESCGVDPPGLEKFLNLFLRSGSKVVEWTPPRLEKFFNFISEFRIKSCGMDPPCWHLVEILENLLFHVLSNDACKFAINLFPITWGPFENVNLLYRWVPLKLDFLGAWKSVWLKHYLVYPIIIISLIIQRNLVTKIRAKWESGLTAVRLKWVPPVISIENAHLKWL